MRQHRARQIVPAERMPGPEISRQAAQRLKSRSHISTLPSRQSGMVDPVNSHAYNTVVCAVIGFVIFGLIARHVPSWVFLAWMAFVVLAYRNAKARDRQDAA